MEGLLILAIFLIGLSGPVLVHSERSCEGGKMYSDCGSACTSALTCETYDTRDDIACDAVCVEGCFCPEGTVDMIGVCINPEDCPACTGGKTYRECGSACPLNCVTYAIRDTIGACEEICVQGCFCPEGTVDLNGVCVAPGECPVAMECGEVTCPLYYSCRGSDDADESVCFPDCDLYNGGCREEQECKVVFYGSDESELNPDYYYITCNDPPYVPCGIDNHLVCDSEWTYCLQQNKTRDANCVGSCLSSNGNCGNSEVCITDVNLRLQCLDKGDLSSECPAGQAINECGAYCQETCEQRLSGEQFACILICGPPACVCPAGLLLYRDRCVDPQLCYVLLQYTQPIDPLPIVEDDEYFYSMFSSSSSASDFVENTFVGAVRDVLSENGYDDVTVDLYGIYEDEGLQIVVRLSGDDVSEETSTRFTLILRDNAGQLPLQVQNVIMLEVDRVGGGFWTTPRIAIVSVAAVIFLFLLLAAIVVLTVCVFTHTKNKTPLNKNKVEIHNLIAEEEKLEEKGRLEFET